MSAMNGFQIGELCALLEESQVMETLVLRNCNIDDDALARIVTALTQDPVRADLQAVNLGFNQITSAGVQHLLQLIASRPQLETLM